MTVPDGLHAVHLLELPVGTWSRAQEQTDGLLREFALAAQVEESQRAHHLPSRLTDLIDTLTAQFGGVSTAQEQQLAAAAGARQAVIDDLVFHVPAEAAAASQVLGDMLDEADDYCRGGQYLLTLAATDDVVAFRRWYLSEFVRQVQGLPPMPWPQYLAAPPA